MAEKIVKDSQCLVNDLVNDTISRQAAVDATWFEPSYTDPLNVLTEVRDRLKALPSAQPEPHWIPCSERLPDEDYWTGANFQYSADVLMTVYNAEDEETIIDYGHTVDGSWYSDTTDCLVPSWWEVLAWMPLPEPYKGDDYEID